MVCRKALIDLTACYRVTRVRYTYLVYKREIAAYVLCREGKFKREILLFLSAVDARVDETASRLFTNYCIWNMNTDRFGAACGNDSIKSLIRDKLPKMPKK